VTPQGQQKTEEAAYEAFVCASQLAQAHGLQVGIEHYRRRKAAGCGGVLVWQFNEPWPAVSWSLLDFYRQPKLAYETVKRLFAPLLICVAYPLQRYQAGDRFCGDVWIVNDQLVELPGCGFGLALFDESGQQVQSLVERVDVMADVAEVVGSFCWILPPGQRWRLVCHISRNGQMLTENEYDLAAFDGLQPTMIQRLRAWLMGHFVLG
jgi:beta-mannosidase